MFISQLIATDDQLTYKLREASHLVREVTDVLKQVLPFIKQWWFQNIPDLSLQYLSNIQIGEVSWAIKRGPEKVKVRYLHDFQVPNYWKIPLLQYRNNKPGNLQIVVDFLTPTTAPNSKTGVRLGGAAHSFAWSSASDINHGMLLLQIFSYTDIKRTNEMFPEFFKRLKYVIYHELEHLADESLNFKVTKDPKMGLAYKSDPTLGDFEKQKIYFLSPTEIRSSVTHIAQQAKQQRETFIKAMETQLGILQRGLSGEKGATPRAVAAVIKKLRKAYIAEYNRRGYGNR